MITKRNVSGIYVILNWESGENCRYFAIFQHLQLSMHNLSWTHKKIFSIYLANYSNKKLSWCSGYHICLALRRSPV